MWQQLKNVYFKPKRFELWCNGVIYECIGIKVFKKLAEQVGRSMGKSKSAENNYFLWDWSKKGLEAFEKKTRYNEGIHIISTLIPLLGFISMWQDKDYGLIFYIAGLLTLINLYALLLQRYTRLRIHLLIVQ